MKLNEMYPSKYVTGADPAGKTWPVTIARIQLERMRVSSSSPEIEKWVLYTAEGKRGIVLGRPLALQIGKILGSDDTDNWIGKKILVYPQAISVAGEQRLVVRAMAYTNGKGEE